MDCGSFVMRRNYILVFSLALCFALGFAFHKYAENALHQHLGVSGATLVRSPGAALRIHNRGWDPFKTQKYGRDPGDVHLRRYVETGLLPLSIDGKRLSDVYPVPKGGGAIASVGATVIILDRLGGLYRYELSTSSFSRLQTPRLPNNIDAYVLQRPDSRYDLADANSNDEFRAHDVVFLSDRKELAVAYDKFDPALGTMNTAVSVIPFDAVATAAIGMWDQVFISDAYAPLAGISSGGGRLAYRGDGKLYLTLGDHYITNPKVSMDPRKTFGKIVEIDLAEKKWRMLTSGHRNPQGLAHLKSGQLLSTEHGPRGGDELNVITEGSNYGWPNVTLGTEYTSYNWDVGTSPVGTHTGYTVPLFAWVPSIGVSQLIEVNNFHPRWDGDLIVGSLKTSSLYRLRLDSGRVLYSEPIWIGQRIRDIAQTANGPIALWTDDTQLLMIAVDNDQLAVKRRVPDVVSNTVVERCMYCHHFGTTNPGDFAPTLSDLFNRPIASDAFRYSEALRAKQGTWTKALLFKFLSDPAEFANGTNMPSLGIDPQQINEIVDVLAQASPPAPPAHE
jgi:cytochrome c2